MTAASKAKSQTSQYAREHKIPYFGICYGMQAAVVDVLRDIWAGLPGANTTEIDRHCADPAIALITEWRTASGEIERRSADSDLGGTMRLGLQECRLKPGTLAHQSVRQGRGRPNATATATNSTTRTAPKLEKRRA